MERGRTERTLGEALELEVLARTHGERGRGVWGRKRERDHTSALLIERVKNQ